MIIWTADDFITEADWQKTVIDLLHVYGYLVHAERPARNQKGWVTPIQGDAGWLDIVAIHPKNHIFWLIECKTEKGKLSKSQEIWIEAGQGCSRIYTRVLRPSDYEQFQNILEDLNVTK